MPEEVVVVCGESLATYGFPDGHPFGPDRHDVFIAELDRSSKIDRVLKLPPRLATRDLDRGLFASFYEDNTLQPGNITLIVNLVAQLY